MHDPDRRGLQRIVGGINVKHYADLFPDRAIKNHLAGYSVALFPLVIDVIRWLSKDERLRINFEEQTVFAQRRAAVLTAISQIPYFRRSDGFSKLAGWKTRPKTTLFEPSDALAYAALQDARNSNSARARLCSPLLGDRMMVGRFMSRVKIREVMDLAKSLAVSKINPDSLYHLFPGLHCAD